MTHKTAYSMGYSGMGERLPDVFKMLALKGATLLLDVRTRPTSPYYGYRKSALVVACHNAGLYYTHAKTLGNPFYRDKKEGLERFEAHFNAQREAITHAFIQHIGDDVPILLCGCADHNHCHRRAYTRVLEGYGWSVEVVDKTWVQP